MSNETIFSKGLWVSRKDDAPDFVIADLSVEVDDFISFCKQYAVNGKISLTCLRAKSGKAYAKVDDYKMKKAKEQFEAEGGNNQEPPQPPPIPSFGAVDAMTQPAPVQPSFTPVDEPQDQIPF